MLQNLRFRHKLMVLPALAMAGLLLIFGVTQHYGAQRAWWLQQVHDGHAPALELGHQLRGALDELQAALQDAVSSEDEEPLHGQLRWVLALHDALKAGQRIPGLEPAVLAQLAAGLEAYTQAIAGVRQQLKDRLPPTAAVESLTAAYQQLDVQLRAFITHHQQQMTQAFAKARQVQATSDRVLKLLVLACLGVLALLTAWLSSAVSRPLRELTEAARRISDGDLTAEVTARGKDELGTLGRSFQRMLVKLRDDHSALKGALEALNQATSQLTLLTQAQTEAVQNQSDGLQRATESTRELQQASSLAAARASKVADAAGRANQLGITGALRVKESLVSIETIHTQVDAILAQTGALARNTLQVQNIVSAVKRLADESDTLSLNAAIEALRAGEHARGFGVVAREMRALADRSVKETQQVRQVLSHIQQAISATTELTHKGREAMNQSFQQVQASGTMMQEVTGFLLETGEMAQEIARNVQLQDLGIAQISSSLEDLNLAMEQSVGGLQHLDMALADLRNGAGQISEVLEGFQI